MRSQPSIRLTLRGKALGVLIASVITLILFLTIPLTQIASKFAQNSHNNKDSKLLIAPPPIVEHQPLLEEVKEDKEDETIELDKEFFPIDISMLDIVLNVGNGNVTDGSGIYVGNFEVDDSEFNVDLEIFEIHQLDKPPIAIIQVSPFYPPAMKRQRIEGSVIAECVVTEIGRVTRVRITKSTRREFEQSVRKAVRSWQFKPGIKDDKKVNTRVRIPFHFNLNTS